MHELTEIPPDFEPAMTDFLDASIRHILRHESAEAYLADLEDLLRRSGFDAWFDDPTPYWLIARSIWNGTPLPSQGFRCQPLPELKRNDACPCGSGKKFKRCCQPRVEGLELDPIPAMLIIHRAIVLLTQKQRTAALEQGPAEIRLAIAQHELDEQRPGKARNILLDLLAGSGLDRQQQPYAVTLLGDAYRQLGHQAAGEKTFQRLLPKLKGHAAWAALIWLANHQLDQERPDLALELLLQANEAAPGELPTGMTLVVTLRALGEDDAAREAAADWLGVAEEYGDADAIAFLKEQARLDTFDEPIEDAPDSIDLDAITRLLEQAGRQPLLPVHFDAGPDSPDGTGQAWVLALPPRVQSAEAVLYRDPDGPDPLDPGLIEQHPELLQSPAFLESLGEASLGLIFHDRTAFNRAFVHQTGRVTEHVLSALPEGGQLPWGWIEHRPVLRALFQSGLDQEDPDHAIPIFQRVLALCPDDNLGVRAPLTNDLLKAGRDEEALALTERYPDDHLAETRYGRVLALVRLNRLHDAETTLAAAYRTLPKVLNYLIARQRKQPKMDSYGMTIGGADQAWLYRQEMRPVFAATPGMLAWLEKMKRQLPK